MRLRRHVLGSSLCLSALAWSSACDATPRTDHVITSPPSAAIENTAGPLPTTAAPSLGPTPAVGPRETPTPVTPTSPGPHVSASARSSGSTVSEASNGKVITVRRGTTVTLVLHSTYWSIDGSSDPAVLDARRAQQHHPDPPGTCVPGVGCGTVSQQFNAHATGTAHLSASRTSCGEALACRQDQTHYDVTVRVTG